MNYSLPGSTVHGFPKQKYWSELAFPSPGDLPDPGIETRSPALQVDSLPAKPAGKPKNTGVGSLSLLQQIFLTQESNRGLLHCRWILYQLSYQGSPNQRGIIMMVALKVCCEDTKRQDVSYKLKSVLCDCFLQWIYSWIHHKEFDAWGIHDVASLYQWFEGREKLVQNNSWSYH